MWRHQEENPRLCRASAFYRLTSRATTSQRQAPRWLLRMLAGLLDCSGQRDGGPAVTASSLVSKRRRRRSRARGLSGKAVASTPRLPWLLAHAPRATTATPLTPGEPARLRTSPSP